MALSLKVIKSNDIVRNVFILMSGTAGAHLITLSLSPIITRLYSPDSLGMLASFLALIAIVLPIASLSYPMAIVLPNSDAQAIKLVNISLRITLIFLIAIALLWMFFSHSFLHFVDLSSFDSYFFLCALLLALIVGTFITILSQWLIRHELFKLSSKALIFRSLFINLSKVSIGLIMPFGKVLIIVTIIGGFIHSIYIFIKLKAELSKKHILFDFGYDKETAKSYSDFPKFRTPQSVLMNVNQNMPIILLASFFGSTPAGLYFLCRSTLLVPITLIAKSVNDVLFPKINKAYVDNKPIASIIIKATLYLVLIAFPPLVFFIFFGEEAFILIFGEEWAGAGIMSQWVALRFYFGFISRACLTALPVFKLERFLLFNSALNFVLSLFGFYLGFVLFDNYLYAVALFSLFGVVPQALIIFVAIKRAKTHDNYIRKQMQ